MCYTGRCIYENDLGECTIGFNRPIPDDALCKQDELAEEFEDDFDREFEDEG